MAFCSNCGQQIANDAKFCPSCGTKTNCSTQSEHQQRKTRYEGEIHKCPNCGGTIDAFVAQCPSCGYEIRGSKGTSVVHEFAKEIRLINSAKQKEELIRNFYVPNTKEDIIEFFILAISNIETDGECREAWAAKMEQTYQKAKLTFGSSNEFAYLEELHQKSTKLLQKQRSLGATGRVFGAMGNGCLVIGKAIAKSLFLKCLILGGIGVIIMIIGFFKGSASGDSDSPYYMLAMLGLFPLLASFIIPMAMHKGDKEENDNE